MKRLIKYFNLILLSIFSFYYADKITNLIIYKSDLMKQILFSKEKYQEKSVDAIVKGKYIIPGYAGVEVDEIASYYNMKSSNEYSSENLIMKEVKPLVSIDNYQNLIIESGNYNKKSVSIITNNYKIYEYAKEENINIDYIKYLDNICLKDNITENCIHKINYKQINKLNNIKILPGDIYYIDSLTIKDFKRFVEMIIFYDLKIIKIKDLISENR